MTTVNMSPDPSGNYSKTTAVGEMAVGLNTPIWCVKNPTRAFFRFFGAFSATMGLVALVAGAAYLISGDRTKPQLSLNPVDLGRSGAYFLRPHGETAADTVNLWIDGSDLDSEAIQDLFVDQPE